MRCEVENDFAATMDLGAIAAGGVGEIVEDEFGAVRLVVAGQVVALLDPGEPVDRLRNCLGRGFRFLGTVTGPGVVRVTNA